MKLNKLARREELREKLSHTLNKRQNDDDTIKLNITETSVRNNLLHPCLTGTNQANNSKYSCAIRNTNENIAKRKKSIDGKFATSADKYNNSARNNFIQNMYVITSLQLKSNKRYAHQNRQSIMLPRRTQDTNHTMRSSTHLYTSLATIVAITLVLSSYLLQTQALSSSATGSHEVATQAATSPAAASISSTLLSAIVSGGQASPEVKQSNANEPALSKSEQSSSSNSQPTSVVASLSSAVASAAAAAAVAAAQNSLSGNDGRSLLSGSSSKNPGHQARSPGLNLALKLADSIPEVPYNILHNMKKIDHAAPFYNVANKMTHSSSGKELSHNLLATALSATSGFGSDQMNSLFKAPIWKRLADGYGDFTSEFRSLFRVPPTPMKGPVSPTTKLLRDITVPALLMLVASAIPNDWHPIKNRKKTFLPTLDSLSTPSLSTPADPLTASASGVDMPNFSLPPQLLKVPQSGLSNIAAQARGLSNLNQPTNLLNIPQLSFLEQPQQAVASTSQLSRIATSGGDINLQMQPMNSDSNWMSPQMSSNSQNQPISEQQIPLQQQPLRRLGEFSSRQQSQPVKHQLPQNIKPVNEIYPHQFSTTTFNQQRADSNSAPQRSGFLSSLTSTLGQNKFVNKIMNSQSGISSSYKMMSLTDSSGKPGRISEARQDQLSDKHRYSLVDLTDSYGSVHNPGKGNMNELSQKLSPSSKPFLLSAMSQALALMFNSQSHGSGSSSSKQHPENYQRMSEDQQTINPKETLSRRQQVGNGVEQRDLTQFLPQTWREIAKRTMSSVQQQASSQWKSIEGQLTNWVQDKLKTLPAAGSSGAGNPQASAPTPVANIIASVSSTAMNILGLGNKNSQLSNQQSNTSTTAVSSDSSLSSSSSGGDKSKTESPNKSVVQQPKSALAGVANMIVNTFTSRQTSPPSSSLSKSNSGNDFSVVASQYPTLTGAQQSSTSSMAAATASTAAALSTQSV